jgi:hypothetical protein
MPIFRGKDFVSAASDQKDSVVAATRSNVNLSALIYSIDDVVLNHKDRVLLAGQTDSAENGIYAWNSLTSKLRRSVDADSSLEVSSGLKVYVEQGTLNSQTNFVLITPGNITLGTTPLTFARENRISGFDRSGSYGSTTKTLTLTLDELGQISNISAVDISVDGGEF